MSVLSVVAASRNDGHGLNLVPRMQVFVNGLADQVERFERDVELILVDWNPPRGQPSLSEVLTAPAVNGFEARVITVPPELHSRLSASDRLSFFQMIAKNVAIRRAAGDAVLATNIDILLSDPLFLDSTGKLADRHLYRADRFDISFDPDTTVEPGALRRSRPVRINARTGIYPVGDGDSQRYVRGLGQLARVAVSNPVDFARRVLRRVDLTRYRRVFASIFLLPELHLNACGDFTLMTRKSWFELRGYPEWEMFSWNLDSMLLYQAAAAGYEFVELDGHPAFHLEHSAGFSLESQAALFARLEERGIPVLEGAAALEVNRAIWRGRHAGRWRTNLDGWGMKDRNLAEVALPHQAQAAYRKA
jgi:hypothetical protein